MSSTHSNRQWPQKFGHPCSNVLHYPNAAFVWVEVSSQFFVFLFHSRFRLPICNIVPFYRKVHIHRSQCTTAGQRQCCSDFSSARRRDISLHDLLVRALWDAAPQVFCFRSDSITIDLIEPWSLCSKMFVSFESVCTNNRSINECIISLLGITCTESTSVLSM